MPAVDERLDVDLGRHDVGVEPGPGRRRQPDIDEVVEGPEGRHQRHDDDRRLEVRQDHVAQAAAACWRRRPRRPRSARSAATAGWRGRSSVTSGSVFQVMIVISAGQTQAASARNAIGWSTTPSQSSSSLISPSCGSSSQRQSDDRDDRRRRPGHQQQHPRDGRAADTSRAPRSSAAAPAAGRARSARVTADEGQPEHRVPQHAAEVAAGQQLDIVGEADPLAALPAGRTG